MSEIIDWIVSEAVAGDDLGAILSGCCHRFVARGLPVLRVGIGMPALDPAVRGLNFVWWRGQDVSAEETPHGRAAEESYRRGPVFHLLERGVFAQRWRLDGSAPAEDFPLFHELRQRGATEFAMQLVPFGKGRTALTGAALSVATDRPGGFTDADLETIEPIAPALGLAAYRIGLGRVATRTFAAYLGADTGRRVLEGAIRRGEGETIEAAILLADLRGFTALADREDPHAVVGWLNEHLDAMGDPVLERGGEILKFIGDGLLGVFPAAVSGDAEGPGDAAAACTTALAAATDALERTAALNTRRAAEGGPVLALDVALHFGAVVYGNIGTVRRLDFTVIGRAVNEASRLEALCETLGRPLLMSESFARHAAGRDHRRVVSLGRHAVRHLGNREVYALADQTR